MNVERIMSFFNAPHTMEILLALLIFIIIITMVRMTLNPDNSFDLKDLVSEDGKVQERKFTRFGAWVVSTWGFIYILVNNPTTFPEWYFVGYMAVWVSNAIMAKYMSDKASSQDKPQ